MKPGQIFILAVAGGPAFCQVLEVGPRYVRCLDDSGIQNYRAPHHLLTLDQYQDHADMMRDEWTGRQYREAMEKARRGFVPPAWWAAAVENSKAA